MVKQTVVEIDVDNASNRCLFFPPLERKVRGRFDHNRVPDPAAKMRANDWPEPIPGQVLGINLDTGEGYIVDPLHDGRFEVTVERIKRRGRRLPPARETFTAHVPTWLFFMREAIKAGHAKLVKGEIPDDLGGEPETRLIAGGTKTPEQEQVAALVSTVDRLTQTVDKLVTAVAQVVEAKK